MHTTLMYTHTCILHSCTFHFHSRIRTQVNLNMHAHFHHVHTCMHTSFIKTDMHAHFIDAHTHMLTSFICTHISRNHAHICASKTTQQDFSHLFQMCRDLINSDGGTSIGMTKFHFHCVQFPSLYIFTWFHVLAPLSVEVRHRN